MKSVKVRMSSTKWCQPLYMDLEQSERQLFTIFMMVGIHIFTKIIQIFSNSWNNNAKNTFIVFDIVSNETRSTAYDIVFRKVFFSCQKFIVSTSTLVEEKKGEVWLLKTMAASLFECVVLTL